MKRLNENLSNQNESYLFPFFWLHGESNEIIEEYIKKISDQGIHNICVESRPHPEFLEDGWWDNLDFIIKTAKERKMKIWILDDAKFPTGFANGKVPTELKKKYLACNRFDIIGSNQHVELDLRMLAGFREYMKDKEHKNDQFYKALLVENDVNDFNAFKENTIVDVTHNYKEGILHLELDIKNYSVFVLYVTSCGGEETTKDYLDPMKKEATQILIDTVYEEHYKRYKHEFGNTITAFFSDEPRFGNIKGTNASIGRIKMGLPWNELVLEKFNELLEFDSKNLLFLFFGDSKEAHKMRFEYMNIVSQLYSENFTQVIGSWCKEREVNYVGHIIEDNNAHARLGYGAGHYFRSMTGQSISGIDIIGGQVVPGLDYHHTSFTEGGSDGEFYHYALSKMGASDAKLAPNKGGRLMCEAFGAYGWVEGLKMMKWITNHMVSHGVNLIVPHAFSLKEFPDWDCPPHFYAHGNNPQFPFFKYWANYTDRLCHLLNGGYQNAKIGVLYHAFAEWSGNYMLMQKVLKELQQNQLDCNVISEDFLEDVCIDNSSYIINGYNFEVLIIPYAERLPKSLLEKITKLSEIIKVIFVNDYPENYFNENAEVLELNRLSTSLKRWNEITLSSYEPLLVYYHYSHLDGDVFVFNNEDVSKTINTQVILNYDNDLQIYDAYNNKTYKLDSKIENGKLIFDLKLEPYNILVLVSGKCDEMIGELGKTVKILPQPSEIKMQSFDKGTHINICQITEQNNLSSVFPDFSGTITYEYEETLETNELLLSIENAYEVVEVIINGIQCDTRIAPPYIFDISGMAKIGDNKIDIKVINSLGRNKRDPFSQYIPVEPLGIVGKVKLHEKKI